MNVVSSFLYKISEWIMRFAFVNLLWIAFSFLGLIIVGFFPATTAMFTVVRKWIMGQIDIPIFQTFWTTYKSEWMKSNLLGGLLLGIGSFIYFEFTIINSSEHTILQLSKYPLLLSVIIFCFLLLYAFPTYVHFHVNLFQVIKNSISLMLVNPYYNIVMILALFVIYLIANILPPLLIFFGGSASAYVIMWCCYQCLINIHRKKEKYNNISEKEPTI